MVMVRSSTTANQKKLLAKSCSAKADGNYAACEKLSRRYITNLSTSGGQEEDAGFVYHNLGECLLKRGQFRDANKMFARAAKIFSGTNQQREAFSLDWESYSRYHLSKGSQTVLACDRALAAYRRLKGAYTRASTILLTRKANCLVSARDFAQASRVFREALKTASHTSTDSDSCRFLADSILSWLDFKGSLSRSKPKTSQLLDQAVMLCAQKLSKLSAPTTRAVKHEDRYFGTTVKDPYRWLERNTPERNKWIDLQNAFTELHLGGVPGSHWLAERAYALDLPERTLPTYRSGKYFFSERYEKNLYRARTPTAIGEKVLDPQELPGNRKVDAFWTSNNGEQIACLVSEDKPKGKRLYVKDLRTNKWKICCAVPLRYSWVSWAKDDSGLYYCGAKERSTKSCVYYHALDTKRNHNKLVCCFSREVTVLVQVLPSGTHLAITTVSKGSESYSLWIQDLEREERLKAVIRTSTDWFHIVGWEKETIYVFINNQAAKLFSIDLNSHHVSRAGAALRKGERKERLYFAPTISSDRMVALYDTKNGQLMRVFRLSDSKLLKEARFPSGSPITDARYLSKYKLRFLMSSYTEPNSFYDLDLKTGRLRRIKRSDDRRGSRYATEKLHARSKDGTLIPFFISYKTPLRFDGDNPVIATGYGGFLATTIPSYSKDMMAFMELGGIFVDTILRGDKYRPDSWHKNGIKQNKHKSFDDFAAVLKWLIKKKITRPERLGIQGFSGGGLLVAATVTRHPELVGAAYIWAGFADMLRYHKFGIAAGYEPEYMTSKTRAGFRVLAKYSPYHHIAKRRYPAVLIETGTEDDRVSMMHGCKFAAALQANQVGTGPILLHVQKGEGHSGGTEGLNVTFLAWQLGLLTGRPYTQQNSPQD
jgi:prolyl oligopeptidase